VQYPRLLRPASRPDIPLRDPLSIFDLVLPLLRYGLVVRVLPATASHRPRIAAGSDLPHCTASMGWREGGEEGKQHPVGQLGVAGVVGMRGANL
jgi:hypothetical protein